MILALFALVVASTTSGSVLDDKVKVQVYYETHCPDSKDFIVSQLYPTYKDVPDIFEAELVPYGKARTTKNPDGTYSFSCQHGANECIGNTIQSCALDKVTDESKVLQFINCMEKASQPQEAAESCANQATIDYEPIRTCANSDEGKALLAKMGDKTNSLVPKLHFVPWIVINGQYDSKKQEMSLTDLKGLICKEYKGVKPEEC